MIITLVGSTRFARLFDNYNEALTLKGHTVYALGFNSSHKEQGEGSGPTPEQKVILDLVHLDKILQSDAVVLVTDETLYFGESTQRELAWAIMHDKKVLVGQDSVHAEVELPTVEKVREHLATAKARSERLRNLTAGLDRMTGGVLIGLGGTDDDEEEGDGNATH